MRPRKEIQCQTAEQFRVWFAKRFKGRRVIKTAFQFFNWAAKADDAKRDEMLAKFDAHCRRAKCRASWENAAAWYEWGVEKDVENK